MCIFVYQVFGMGGLKCQLYGGFVGLFFINVIDYITHYGLRRKMGEDGLYETITFMHAWSAIDSPMTMRM